MFQLTFTLKQHTPIIHFQHDQAGATLRATELKPKLDQYIIEQSLARLVPKVSFRHKQEARDKFKLIATTGLGEHSKPEWKQWLIGKGKAEHVALDYKVRITDQDVRSLDQRSFGQVQLISEVILDKKAISSSSIACSINTLNSNLLVQIKELISSFFLFENFGTRQNKAWGCYFHEDHESWDTIKQAMLSSGLPVYVFDGKIPIPRREVDVSNFYATRVMRPWRILKSGFNFGGEYKKSLLFKYLCSKELRWDKRWMKHRLQELIDSGKLPSALLGRLGPNDCSTEEEGNSDRNDTTTWEDRQELDYAYVFGRAMLGLPEHIEFRAEGNRIYQVIVKNSNGIERFKAPVTFKIFQDRLFAIGIQPTAMLNQQFHFEVQVKRTPPGGKKPEAVGGPIPIVNNENMPFFLGTPSTRGDFDIAKFLDKFFPLVRFNRLNSNNVNQL